MLYDDKRLRQRNSQAIIPAHSDQIAYVLYWNETGLLTLFTNGLKYTTVAEERSQLLVSRSRHDTIPLAW